MQINSCKYPITKTQQNRWWIDQEKKVFVFTALCNIFLSGYMYKNKTDPFQTKQQTQLTTDNKVIIDITEQNQLDKLVAATPVDVVREAIEEPGTEIYRNFSWAASKFWHSFYSKLDFR